MMKNSEINIRDPFILCENGRYYMYGTRARNLGKLTGGFDIYISTDLRRHDLLRPIDGGPDRGCQRAGDPICGFGLPLGG